MASSYFVDDELWHKMIVDTTLKKRKSFFDSAYPAAYRQKLIQTFDGNMWEATFEKCKAFVPVDTFKKKSREKYKFY